MFTILSVVNSSVYTRTLSDDHNVKRVRVMPSCIDGIGLFAMENIKIGEFNWVIFDIVLNHR